MKNNEPTLALWDKKKKGLIPGLDLIIYEMIKKADFFFATKSYQFI